MSNNNNTLESVLSMKGGQGEGSYFSNSSNQLTYANATRPMVKDLIKKMFEEKSMEMSKVWRVVDTGCATGANTLVAVNNIISNLMERCYEFSLQAPEFQVFFSDLPSNDFNTLIRNLPSKTTEDESSNSANAGYYIGIVPGSHYNRLFPTRTINFFHSSISLHWLSRVPPEVEDMKSPAWNGGHVFISNPVTEGAYLKQFTADFTSFLKCRAEESVIGGGLFITLIGRSITDVDPAFQVYIPPILKSLDAVLQEMVLEGMIEETLIDKINSPFYFPSVDELHDIVEEEGSFKIIDIKTEKVLHLNQSREENVNEFARALQLTVKSLFESILYSHLGENGLVDELFRRIERWIVRNYFSVVNDMVDIIGLSLIAYATNNVTL